MKVIAVIVTYNRLGLLKKCIDALTKQTRKPDDIIVVNNGSTDATNEWLACQPVKSYSQENLGGAGGFSYGIKLAYSIRADWIWLMDDDTIPAAEALHQLLAALQVLERQREKVGFLSSSVVWIDGSLHEMNRTYELKDKRKLAKFSFASVPHLPLIQFGTFVSMLLSAKAVEKVGFPIKEYFIWCDDVEYSKRIIASGMAGFAVEDSIITHETPTNHQSNVFIDPPSSIWKFRYGLRNELFTKRLHEGEWKFWLSWIHRMFIMPIRISIRRRSDRWPFIKVVWKTSLDAILFRPAIEKAAPLNVGPTSVRAAQKTAGEQLTNFD